MESIVAGMEIRVPRRHKLPPVPCQEVPGIWGCYAVQAGDTMFTIARKIGADPYLLCHFNQVINCSMIDVGQKLAYLAGRGCTPRPGAWNCWTVPNASSGGDLPAPLTVGTVASIANTSM